MYSKTLGIWWDLPGDAFCYVAESVMATTGVTRRMMLSQVSQMYDPLGLISPVIQRGRLLFQEATRMGLLWDDPIPEGLQQNWVSWLESLSGIEHFRFPRCLVPGQFPDGPIEIHHFCDASLNGFGACSYIRIVDHHGEIQINLILGKGRLAPIKQVTVPKLELCAAVEAVKLDCIVRHYLDIQIVSSTFWTDSQIVLSYIRSQNRRFKIYAANMVAMIRRSSSLDQRRHVSGDQNPADVVSRGCAVSDFPDIWLNGPAFLRMFKCDWYEPPAIPMSMPSQVTLFVQTYVQQKGPTLLLIPWNPWYSITYAITNWRKLWHGGFVWWSFWDKTAPLTWAAHWRFHSCMQQSQLLYGMYSDGNTKVAANDGRRNYSGWK